jgi:hypothetical protein
LPHGRGIYAAVAFVLGATCVLLLKSSLVPTPLPSFTAATANLPVGRSVPMSNQAIVFLARSCHTIASDRIYRVEIHNRTLYFLRIGGQFNVERDNPFKSEGHLAAGAILATGELLFRTHKHEEMQARDYDKHPDELLDIHPHNFKLTPSDIRSAVFLPKRWYACLREHHGRLVFTLVDRTKWEFEFEELESLQVAFAGLGQALGPSAETEIEWNDRKARFERTRRQPLNNQQ